METLEELNLKLHSLVIFRQLLEDPVLAKLPPLLSSTEKNMAERVKSYTAFVSALFQENVSLTHYVWEQIASNENMVVLRKARGASIEDVLNHCLVNELKLLEEISHLSAKSVKNALGYSGFLPEWENSNLDFVPMYEKRLDRIAEVGYGQYARFNMFHVQEQRILPVKSPDPIRLRDLKGYDQERSAVIENTQALLKGMPAANVLLYGDAGTGKSSTVKAIVNEFWDKGLRLIEISKKQLLDLTIIVESLSRNPLKFILFIDDLSFAQDNEEIGALKAILEGSAAAKTSNIVIYATSNRRHLVKEKFSERGEDDIHRNETIQEQISLSERFGLCVGFFKPDKRRFLDIVHQLAEQQGIEISKAELDMKAEAYALERGGRSARAARHFVEYLTRVE